MDQEDEYERNLREAERAAREASSHRQRERHLRMAKGWAALLQNARRQRALPDTD